MLIIYSHCGGTRFWDSFCLNAYSLVVGAAPGNTLWSLDLTEMCCSPVSSYSLVTELEIVVLHSNLSFLFKHLFIKWGNFCPNPGWLVELTMWKGCKKPNLGSSQCYPLVNGSLVYCHRWIAYPVTSALLTDFSPVIFCFFILILHFLWLLLFGS